MSRRLRSNQMYRNRKGSRSILAFCWISGLLCGMVTSLSAGPSLIGLMRSSLSRSVSIFGLLCIGFLPFLIAITVVSLSKTKWIILICFVKAFLFSFVSIGIFSRFGSASFLLRLLLLFSDCFCVCLLYFLSLRVLSSPPKQQKLLFVFLFSLEFLVRSIDYRIISPFWARLIIF